MIESIREVLNGTADIVDFGYFAIAVALIYFILKLIIYCFKK